MFSKNGHYITIVFETSPPYNRATAHRALGELSGYPTKENTNESVTIQK